MVNIVRIQNPNAPGISDPYGDAQRQQQYADLIQARSMQPRNYGTASNAQAIQMGITQLAQALLGRSLQKSAGTAGDQADAVQAEINKAKLEALIPAITKGAQVNLPTTLDSLGPSDPAVTMQTAAAVPDALNPQHADLSAALAGTDPRAASQLLTQALASRALAPPQQFDLAPGANRYQVGPDGKSIVVASNPKETTTHLERKTRLLDNQMAQDYNFDPSGGPDQLIGAPYKQKAPPATQVNLTDPTTMTNVESDARKVAAGLMPVPPLTGRGSNAGYNAAVRKRAYELHPTLDAADFPKRAVAEKAFAGSIDGRNLDAYNTIAQHVDYGEQAYKALQNGDYPALNAIANHYGIQTGESPAATYQSLATFLGNETARATIGGQSGEADRSKLAQMFSMAASPAAAAGQYAQAKVLIGGRIMASRRRYQSSVRTYDVDKKAWVEDPEAFDTKLTPAALEFEKAGATAGATSSTPTPGWGKAVVVKP